MLKKMLVMSMACAISCNISFSKPTRALDLAEIVLSETEKSGIRHVCHGNDREANCHIRDIVNSYLQIKNIYMDIALTDFTLKQKFSADIEMNLGKYADYNIFIPKNIVCEAESHLKDLENLNTGSCTLKSDVATLEIDMQDVMQSKKFRYKTMFNAVRHFMETITYFSNKFEKIQSLYAKDSQTLREQRDNDLRRLYAEENTKQNSYEIHMVREAYEINSDALTKRYVADTQKNMDNFISWLKQYNIDIKEIKIYLKTKKLAESLFAIYAKDFLNFNENTPLSNEEKKQREEEKKRITAEYYAGLELIRAAAITFVSQSPYLNEHLKKNLTKVVSEHAKLFDPNSHKRSLKILVQHLSDKPINLGEQVEKLKNADDRDTKLQILFEIINQYDIKVVRYWPNFNL